MQSYDYQVNAGIPMPVKHDGSWFMLERVLTPRGATITADLLGGGAPLLRDVPLDEGDVYGPVAFSGLLLKSNVDATVRIRVGKFPMQRGRRFAQLGDLVVTDRRPAGSFGRVELVGPGSVDLIAYGASLGAGILITRIWARVAGTGAGKRGQAYLQQRKLAPGPVETTLQMDWEIQSGDADTAVGEFDGELEHALAGNPAVAGVQYKVMLAIGANSAADSVIVVYYRSLTVAPNNDGWGVNS
jgi:hypothetical protein